MRICILNYHRFPEHSLPSLRRVCGRIAAHYRVVSMDDIASGLPNGGDELAFAFTVDDGYRDFLNAVPVFAEFGIPVALYVATDFVGHGKWLWFDAVSWLCAHTSLRTLTIDTGAETGPLRFVCPDARARSAAWLTERMKRLPDSERLMLIDRLPELLQCELPAVPPEPYEPAGLQELLSCPPLVTLGAHTCSHPVLSSVDSHAALRREIAGCRQRLECWTGRPVRHFAYPNGKRKDINDTVCRMVQESYQTAVTTVGGVNVPPAGLVRLHRVWVEPWMTVEEFEAQMRTAGAVSTAV